MKEKKDKVPTIIEILDGELKKAHNGLDDVQSVQTIAERMGIDSVILTHWMEKDRLFQEGLRAVKQAFDNDPWKDTEWEEIKFDEFTLMFGISVVLEETKKRYTV
jgi:hypothetical protein